MVNKKGWLRIVEALTMILLIAGVLLLVLSGSGNFSNDKSEQIYDKEYFILRTVQLDEGLRGEVLSTTPPIDTSESSFPASIKNKIDGKTPANLECIAQTCSLNSNPCVVPTSIPGDKNIFTKNSFIFVNPDSSSYSPRQLKIF